jgi:hypothetical protein
MRSFFQRSRARQLEEVKAILHHLQALSTDPGVGVPAVSQAKPTSPNRIAARRAVAAGLGLVGGLATIGFGSYVLHDLRGRTGPSPGVVASRSSEGFSLATVGDRQPVGNLAPSAQSILEKALQDIAAGHIRAARDALIRIQDQGSADMAWMLARSYDPNFLGEIAHRDAEPDVTEAARWYRIWYSRAVTDGLVADSVSLERIIRSMPEEPSRRPSVK